MKIPYVKLTGYAFLALMFAVFSCVDLKVENKIEPDSARALTDPEDLKSLAGGAFRTIHNAHQDYSGPGFSMITMADQGTCSWGSAGTYDLSSEPRKGIRNDVNYPYLYAFESTWKESYNAISSVNDVLTAIKKQGVAIGNTDDTKMVDKLQRGTILHFPVPATELEIIQEDIYTIEGTPDGENISNGFWTGLDGLVSPPG